MNENGIYETEVMTEVSSSCEGMETEIPENDFMDVVCDSNGITDEGSASNNTTSKVVTGGIVGLAIVGAIAIGKYTYGKVSKWNERRKSKKLAMNANSDQNMVDTVCEEHKEE